MTENRPHIGQLLCTHKDKIYCILGGTVCSHGYIKEMMIMELAVSH